MCIRDRSWAVPGSASRRAPPFPRWLQSYNDPAMIYSSPVIHTVTLVDLVPGEVYEYELADGVHAFRLPPATYPIRLGLAADVGQTVVSNRSFAKLAALDPDAVLLSGDLSYAAWKSNFRRPTARWRGVSTPSTGRCPRKSLCSMAWRITNLTARCPHRREAARRGRRVRARRDGGAPEEGLSLIHI